VVPLPLACGLVGDRALLVLPWLTLQGGAAGWSLLGRGLARLHGSSRSGAPGRGYGFAADNFIGSTPQHNGWRASWPRFFAECRLAPQFAMAEARGEPYAEAAALLERIPRLLGGHVCEPVLVHGDLWSGNAGLLDHGAAIFDPAAHWGDREVDLAMARLFGGFPEGFFSAYGQEWPLPEGARQRIPLYNLYHLLNHANLFGGGHSGGGYRGQAERSIRRLLERADGMG
jgi:fructosamine-3-kinase